MRAPHAPRLPIVAFVQQGMDPLVVGRDKVNGFKPALITHREGEDLWFHKVRKRKRVGKRRLRKEKKRGNSCWRGIEYIYEKQV